MTTLTLKPPAHPQTKIPMRLNIAGAAHIFGIGEVFYNNRYFVVFSERIARLQIGHKITFVVAVPIIVKSGSRLSRVSSARKTSSILSIFDLKNKLAPKSILR
jgi:hypothetical protein